MSTTLDWIGMVQIPDDQSEPDRSVGNFADRPSPVIGDRCEPSAERLFHLELTSKFQPIGRCGGRTISTCKRWDISLE